MGGRSVDKAGRDPTEEIDGARPVIGVGGEGGEDGVLVEVQRRRRLIWGTGRVVAGIAKEGKSSGYGARRRAKGRARV